MADAKIIRVPASGVSGTSEIDDNLDPSVLFESADGKDYFEIDTTDGSEKLILAKSGAPVGIGADPSSGVHLHVQGGDARLRLHNTSNENTENQRDSEIQFYGQKGDGTVHELGTLSFMHGSAADDTQGRFKLDVNNGSSMATRMTIEPAGATTFNGVVKSGDGNNSAPGHSFSSSNNTGMYHDGSNGAAFCSNGGLRLLLNATGELCTGGSTANPGSNAAAGSLHVYTGTTSHTQVHADWDELVIEGAAGNRSGITIMSVTNGKGGIAFSDPGNAQAGMITYGHDSPQFMDFVTEGYSALRIYDKAIIPQKGAIQYRQGTGADTATTQAAYLADTNATLIIDFANGNFGDVTLAANVTAVKFFNVPVDGVCATVTARITQDSSTRTVDYSDSAVTVYSDSGSTAITGEVKFSGGVHHTQSTGSGDVDLISFSAFRADGAATAITGATQANPCVVTSNSHNLANGDQVTFASVSGMTQLNGNTYTVAGVTTNTFQLSGINSSGYDAYSSGGTFTLHIGNVYAAVIGQDFS